MRQSIADIRETINQSMGAIEETRKAILRANELLLASPRNG